MTDALGNLIDQPGTTSKFDPNKAPHDKVTRHTTSFLVLVLTSTSLAAQLILSYLAPFFPPSTSKDLADAASLALLWNPWCRMTLRLRNILKVENLTQGNSGDVAGADSHYGPR